MKLLLTLTVVASGLMTASLANAAVDADAAQAAIKESGCLTCHAVDKKKIGPAFKDVAKKYKGKADGAESVTKQLTTKPMVDAGGEKVPHKSLKNADSVSNVVQWILSL
ncbi:MAG TPA: c-type cytochrome [Ramlibacter sp.]|nr:c-type cytochrome [Ramlibacter sp.]